MTYITVPLCFSAAEIGRLVRSIARGENLCPDNGGPPSDAPLLLLGVSQREQLRIGISRAQWHRAENGVAFSVAQRSLDVSLGLKPLPIIDGFMDILYYTRYLPNCQEGGERLGELFEKIGER